MFKTKTFARWAKKVLPDDLLCLAAREIERGEFEADLGQGVCKKRIALPGQGKSGSTRSLVAKQHKLAIFFLAGREKNDPGTDFSSKEEEAAKLVGRVLHAATIEKIGTMKTDGVLKEICHEQENKCE
ncbi:MAG: type II toxin-antitoxin system RelE/ParE family toxin [Pseudomonadota bacterium]